MRSTLVHEQLAAVVEALHQGLGERLGAVVLFGSRARGDAGPESDWDLLILATELPHRPLPRSRYMLSLLPEEWRYRVNILAHTPEEWFRRVTPLALDVTLDGVVLYDPKDIISSRLISLRNQLVRLGLERRRMNRGWLWLWRKKYKPHWTLEWPK